MQDIHKKGKITNGILVGVCSFTAIAVIIIAIAWSKLKIDEPIFFRYLVEHYLPTISDSVIETSTLQLVYLQDITDKREVTEVSFVNHPELNVSVLNNNIDKFGIYKVSSSTLFLEWDQNAMDDLPKSVEVNDIMVKYSDDSNKTINIGSICIYSGTSENDLLEPVNSIPLWELERMQTYKAMDILSIDGLSEVSKKYLNEADIIKSYSLIGNKIDITDVSGAIKLKKYEMIEFNMQLKDFDRMRLIDLDSAYDYYLIRPELIYHTEAGASYFTAIHNQPIRIYFENYRDVRHYVKRHKTK